MGLAVSSLTLSMLFLGSGGMASASVVDEPSSPSGRQVVTTSAEAAALDLRETAKALGISPVELRDRTKFAPEFDAFVATLQSRFPQSFSWASGQGVTGAESIVGFKGTVPVEVEQLAKALPFEVALKGNYLLAETERLRAEQVALDVFWKKLRTQTAGAEIKPGTATIEIVYSGGRGAPTEQLTRAITTAAGQGLVPGVPFSVQYTRTDGPVFEDEVLSGGTRLTAPDAANSVICTSSFTVRNTTGGTGLLTASHCDDNLRYEGRTNLNWSMAGHTDAAKADAQWFRSTTETVWNQFVYQRTNGTQKLRHVLSTGDTPVGRQVCKYGWYSNFGCSYVIRRDYPTTNANGVQYLSTIMQDYITTGGDSGGPYFSEHQDRGLYKGRITYNGAARSHFTRILQVQANSNLRVVVS